MSKFSTFYPVVLLTVLIVGGCSSEPTGEVEAVEETEISEEVVVEEGDLSPEEYYLEQTRPAITQVWTDYDETFDEMIDQCFKDVNYHRETMYDCMITFVEKHEQLKENVEALPVEGLTGDLSHLKSFQENSILALEIRVNYCRAVISNLGDNGIRDLESLQSYWRMGNRHSLSSMDDVEAYETSLGF